MKKLTKKEKELLKVIAGKVTTQIESKNKDLDYMLTNSEYKLLRKLAMHYEVDKYSFIIDWQNSFVDMNEDEALFTMYHVFNGLNKRIEDTWKDAGDEES